MEKIQAALQKARATRDAGAQAGRAPGAPGAKKVGRRDQLWADLRQIELSGQALTNHRVVTRQASQEATPFDILRTKLLLQMRQNGWKRLAITSPMSKSGKTTTACNLAIGLGRQSGLNAMLFDMDLNDPSVSEFLDHQPDRPISDVLSGRVSFGEQAVRIGDNIAVSLSSQKEADPTRILLSPETSRSLDSIQASYDPDIMIFDTPSILEGDDTRAFLKNVDCALIIARANGTKYGHFDACEREVAEHTNVLGVVLNAFRTKNPESYID